MVAIIEICHQRLTKLKQGDKPSQIDLDLLQLVMVWRSMKRTDEFLSGLGSASFVSSHQNTLDFRSEDTSQNTVYGECPRKSASCKRLRLRQSWLFQGDRKFAHLHHRNSLPWTSKSVRLICLEPVATESVSILPCPGEPRTFNPVLHSAWRVLSCCVRPDAGGTCALWHTT